MITSRFKTYDLTYALDYCGNLADLVASWVFVSCGRGLNSYYFGDRRDRGGHQASHGSRRLAAWPTPNGCASAPEQNVYLRRFISEMLFQEPQTGLPPGPFVPRLETPAPMFGRRQALRLEPGAPNPFARFERSPL